MVQMLSLFRGKSSLPVLRRKITFPAALFFRSAALMVEETWTHSDKTLVPAARSTAPTQPVPPDLLPRFENASTTGKTPAQNRIRSVLQCKPLHRTGFQPGFRCAKQEAIGGGNPVVQSVAEGR